MSKVDNNKRFDLQFKVDKSSDEKLIEGLKKVCSELVPMFKGKLNEKFIYKVISGGITNQLYKCSFGNDSVLVRLFGDKTDLIIDREYEEKVVKKLSKEGFGPIIYGIFINGRIESFLPGTCLKPEEMTLDEIWPKIGSRLAQFHQLEMPFDKKPSLWKTLDGWLKTAMKVTFKDEKQAKILKELNLSKIKDEIKSLKEKLKDSKTPIVFCHNDLLSGNIMYDKENKKIKFIDFEYGSYNFRVFDIANHFCETCGFDCNWDNYPTKKNQEKFFRSYIATMNNKDPKSVTDKEIDQFYNEVEPFVLASHFFWGLWGIVQAKFSPIDFDFLGYSKLRIEGYYAFKNKNSK